MSKKLMKCGHVENAASNGRSACVICGCLAVSEDEMNLDNREAKCGFCSKTTKSEEHLAFFSYKPNEEKDGYYCGCMGWD